MVAERTERTERTEMAVVDGSSNEYSTQQIDLIKRTVANGCSDDELALFIEVCRGTGLNPFMRQVYAIKRRQKEGDAWVERMTIQTGIDGYRLLAARTGALAGIDDATYDHEDDEAGEHPAWAQVTVWRFVQGQRVPFTAKARWREYAALNRDGNPVAMWAKMPYLMLAKCAEALALRKAFPAELSGVYTREEMDQADNPPMPYVEQAQPAQPQQTWNVYRDADVTKALRALGFARNNEQHDYIEGVKDEFTAHEWPWEKEAVMEWLRADYRRIQEQRKQAKAAPEFDLGAVDTGAPGN